MHAPTEPFELEPAADTGCALPAMSGSLTQQEQNSTTHRHARSRHSRQSGAATSSAAARSIPSRPASRNEGPSAVSNSAAAAAPGGTSGGPAPSAVRGPRDPERVVPPALSLPLASVLTGSGGSQAIEAMFDQFLVESLAFAAKQDLKKAAAQQGPAPSRQPHSRSSSDDGSDEVDEDQLATVLGGSTAPASPAGKLMLPVARASPASGALAPSQRATTSARATPIPGLYNPRTGPSYPSHPLLAQRDPPPTSNGLLPSHLRPISVPIQPPSPSAKHGVTSPLAGRPNQTQMSLVYAHARHSTSYAAMGAMSPLRAAVMTPLSNLAVDLPKELRVGPVHVMGRNWDVTADTTDQNRVAATAALDTARRAIADIATSALDAAPELSRQDAHAGSLSSPLPGLAPGAWLSDDLPRVSSPVSRTRHQPPWRKFKSSDVDGEPGSSSQVDVSAPIYVQDVMEGTVVRDQLSHQLAAADALLRPQSGGNEVGRLLRRHVEGATELNLSYSLNSLPQVVALVEGLPGLPDLQRLCLGHNDLTDMAFELLAVVLATPACGRLTALDLRHNRVTSLTVDRLLPLLQEEAVTKAILGSRRPLGTPTHAVLSELVLSGNNIGNGGVEILCEALESEKCSLVKLDVSRCGFGERGAAALGRMIADNRHLASLNVGWNNLGLRGSRHLAAGIQEASALTELLMAWTGIGDTGSADVAKAMGKNITLKTINLSGCGVSADACIVLQAALEENNSLTALILRNNPLGLMGAKRLLSTLHTGTLTRLDILGCSFQPINCLSGTFDPLNPDGMYALDLGLTAHRQIAYELLQLAATQGVNTWVGAAVNEKPFRVTKGMSKMQIPVKGILKLQYRSTTPILLNDAPLTDMQLDRVWTSILLQGIHEATSAPKASLSTSNAALLAAAASAEYDAPGDPPRPSPRLQAQPSPAQAPTDEPGGSSAGFLPLSASPSALAAASGRPPVHLNLSSLQRGAGGGAGGLRAQVSNVLSPRDATAMKGANDEWKLGLLSTIASNNYLTCVQLTHILGSFESRDGRIEAVIKAVGALSDPENLSLVYACLDGSERAAVDDRIGSIKHFTPANPTGRWNLMLSHHAHFLVARRLITLYCQQLDAKHSSVPYRMCFVSCTLDGAVVDTKDPRRIVVPREGSMTIVFSDLRPIAADAECLTEVQLAVLASMLTSVAKMDGAILLRVMDHPDIAKATNLAEAYLCWVQLAKRYALVDVDLAASTGANGRGSPTLGHSTSNRSHRPSSNSGSDVSTSRRRRISATNSTSSRNGNGNAPSRSTTPTTGSRAHQRENSLRHSAERGPLGAGGSKGPGGRASGLLVRDIKGFTEAMRVLAVKHYMECDQIIYLLSLLPEQAEDERVELCCSWWARCTDRVDHWTDVMRAVSQSLQVRLAQRLGYYNIYNPVRPALHYRLRMFRADEHEIAWQLYNRAIKASHDCIFNFYVNNELKRITEGTGLWTVMTGAAVSGTIPTSTVEFDFEWPEDPAVAGLSGMSARVVDEWMRLQIPVHMADRFLTNVLPHPDALAAPAAHEAAGNPAVWAMSAAGSVATGHGPEFEDTTLEPADVPRVLER